MPKKETIERAREDRRAGKAPSTQAGEFVREEIHHVREGKHGARSAKQAIAIGLSKARRAGVKLAQPAEGKTSASVRRKVTLDSEHGREHPKQKPSRKRSRAVESALEREGHGAVSKKSLSQQARWVARSRSKKSRSVAAKKAARARASHRNMR